MPLIHLTTFIAAPPERVFDLSRSIDLHQQSMQAFNEKAVEGKTSGLLSLNETVTWKAKHLLKERQLKIKMTALNAPYSFTDEQVEGDFKKLRHEHFFKPIENGTIMIDQFYFEVPEGFLKQLVSRYYLHRYLQQLLEERNRFIKKAAEGEEWKRILKR